MLFACHRLNTRLMKIVPEKERGCEIPACDSLVARVKYSEQSIPMSGKFLEFPAPPMGYLVLGRAMPPYGQLYYTLILLTLYVL